MTITNHTFWLIWVTASLALWFCLVLIHTSCGPSNLWVKCGMWFNAKLHHFYCLDASRRTYFVVDAGGCRSCTNTEPIRAKGCHTTPSAQGESGDIHFGKAADCCWRNCFILCLFQLHVLYYYKFFLGHSMICCFEAGPTISPFIVAFCVW